MSGDYLAALAFIVLAFLIDIVNFGAWIVFIAMLAISFVLGIATFGALAMADVIFTWGFFIFAHCYFIPLLIICGEIYSFSISSITVLEEKSFNLWLNDSKVF